MPHRIFAPVAPSEPRVASIWSKNKFALGTEKKLFPTIWRPPAAVMPGAHKSSVDQGSTGLRAEEFILNFPTGSETAGAAIEAARGKSV